MLLKLQGRGNRKMPRSGVTVTDSNIPAREEGGRTIQNWGKAREHKARRS